MNPKDIDWPSAPSETAVWIIPRERAVTRDLPADWYYLSDDKKTYRHHINSSYWLASDADHCCTVYARNDRKEIKTPNWDDAPSWADKLVKYEKTNRTYWSNGEKYQNIDPDSLPMNYDSGSVYNFELVENRPEGPELEVWNGEGKPPINIEIEIKHKDATEKWARPDFHKATLAFVGNDLFVATEEGRETIGHINQYHFRPAITDEQRFIDECCQTYLKVADKYHSSDNDVSIIFKAMFNEGYKDPRNYKS